MLFLIAWRNIWRSWTRSLVVIISVLLAVWAFIFMMSFMTSMINSYVENAIRFQTSHLQLHNPEFNEDKELKFTIDNKAVWEEKIKNHPDVKVYAERTLVNGMIRSARSTRGIVIKGVQPERENLLSNIKEKILEGSYFTDDKKNEILISEELAEKLQLKLRKKVVLQFQDFNNDISQGSFRVVGIYKTGNTVFDLGMALVDQKDLNRLIGRDHTAHEFAIYLNSVDSLLPVQQSLQLAIPDSEVENYRQLSPDVSLYESQIGITSLIFLIIFMLALVFGIINTMLMAVLERTKEIGMLMAVGMNKLRVFGMIVMETLLLGIIGAPLGMAFGWLTVEYLAQRGINLGAFSEGIERFGMSTIIRPELPTEIYIQLMTAVFITAVLASIYPAFKAVRLKPMEAIHKI